MIATSQTYVTTAQVDRELRHIFSGRRQPRSRWSRLGDLCVGLILGGLHAAVLCVLWQLVEPWRALVLTGALACFAAGMCKDEPMDAVRPVWRVLKARIW